MYVYVCYVMWCICRSFSVAWMAMWWRIRSGTVAAASSSSEPPSNCGSKPGQCMYVWMYVCMYMYLLYTYINGYKVWYVKCAFVMSTRILIQHVCSNMYVCMYVCVYVCILGALSAQSLTSPWKKAICSPTWIWKTSNLTLISTFALLCDTTYVCMCMY